METFRRDHSRALSAIGVIALLAGLFWPGEQLRAQEVDKDGLYSQPFLVLDPDMHTAPIKAMVTDAAGRYIITGSDEKSVRVWSANDGHLLRTIRLPSGPGNEGKVYTVAVSPDGNTIAAAGGGDHIFLFERATGRQVGHIGPLPNTVTNKLAFSHDGRRIAAGIGDNSLRLFDVASRKEIAFDDNYKGAIYGISFDTTGRIATTSEDRKLRLYDRDLKLIRDARAPGPSRLRPFQIAFSPDNKRLAVGYDGPSEGPPRVDVVDGQTLHAKFAASTTGYGGLLARVAWSMDGNILYAGNTASRDMRGTGHSLVFAWKDGGRGSLQVFPASSDAIQIFENSPMAASLLPLWVPACRFLIGTARSYGNSTRRLLISGLKPELSKPAWTESKFCFISTATMTSHWPLSTLASEHLIYLQRGAQSSSPPALRDFQSRIGRIAMSRKFEENLLQFINSKRPAALPLHATLAVSGLEASGTSATSMPQVL